MAHDIIDSVGKLNAERASHVASVAPGDVLLHDLTATPVGSLEQIARGFCFCGG